ncbi:MAG: histone deacetylase family protein [Deltaproteobacteria bacterium]|nr:histone deacetylase family protein [Deltaproteobacteria bacterium]
MKVVFHEAFYPVYAGDPAAAAGRMEAIMETVAPVADVVEADFAAETDIARIHTRVHMEWVKRQGVFETAALAAGGAILAARIGLEEPCFGAIRPPGHHASTDWAWGFCYFNNMAIAVARLKAEGKIDTAYILDIDLHYGDGTVETLGNKDYVTIHNVAAFDRSRYLDEVRKEMESCRADIIGISAGFDNHLLDWGGTLETEDYREIGRLAAAAAKGCNGGCFALLEGGYNHQVLGENVLALMEGLSGM